MSRDKQRKMTTALKRVLRRAQLWHAACLACDDEETWRAAWPAIGRAVERQLDQEFGA